MPGKNRFKLPSGTTWPLPAKDAAQSQGVEGKLRHSPGKLSRADLLHATSVLSAYRHVLEGAHGERSDQAVAGEADTRFATEVAQTRQVAAPTSLGDWATTEPGENRGSTANQRTNTAPKANGPTATQVASIEWKLRKVPEALMLKDMLTTANILAVHAKDAGVRWEPEVAAPEKVEPEKQVRTFTPWKTMDPLEITESLRGDYPQPTCPVCGRFGRRRADWSWKLSCLYWDDVTRLYVHL